MAKRIRQPKKTNPESVIELPKIDEDFQEILEVRQQINPMEEWNAIKDWINTNPTEIHDIRDAVRLTAHVASRAKDLLEVTKIAEEEYRIKYRARMQIWREDALIYWEAEKSSGLHKQITESMIEDRIIAQWETLYLELKTRMTKFESLVKTFSEQVKIVTNKGTDLRKLLEAEIRRPAAAPRWFDGDENKDKK